MKPPCWFLVCMTLLLGCSETSPRHPHVIIQSANGEIELELLQDKAPKSVAAFLSYVDAGYYRNCSFYRALNEDNQPTGSGGTDLIQGGVWKNGAKLPPLPGIEHESTKLTGIHHLDGTVSLARLAPGTAGTEFFICVGDQPGFDFGGENNPDGQGYAAFGQVVKGMDLVKAMWAQPVRGEYLMQRVRIYNITRK